MKDGHVTRSLAGCRFAAYFDGFLGHFYIMAKRCKICLPYIVGYIEVEWEWASTLLFVAYHFGPHRPVLAQTRSSPQLGIGPLNDRTHCARSIRSLIWGFGESCTTVYCITSQPANVLY